jgi:rhamnosyltransferase
MISSNKILIVIVSFNDSFSLNRLINSINHEKFNVFIFDNSTDLSNQDRVKAYGSIKNISVVGFGKNYGIGYALNNAINYASTHQYEWIVTFDQDSIIIDGQIEALLEATSKFPEAKSFSSCYQSIDQSTDLNVAYAITSGNLVHIDAVKEVGGYDESFFIDAIDFDISLKLRRRGYKIVRVAKSKMFHQIGLNDNSEPKNKLLYLRHSSQRRYYQTRNILTLCTRHIIYEPIFIGKLFFIFMVSLIMAAIYDESSCKTLKMIGLGFYDFIIKKNRIIF